MFCMVPKFNTKATNKLQIMQSKCIRFCLQLDEMRSIFYKEFYLKNLAGCQSVLASNNVLFKSRLNLLMEVVHNS